MSATLVRILVVSGAFAGSAVGAFIALVKLVPERAKVVVGYQGEIIDDLREDMQRKDVAHKEEIEALRLRISTLENEVLTLKGVSP